MPEIFDATYSLLFYLVIPWWDYGGEVIDYMVKSSKGPECKVLYKISHGLFGILNVYEQFQILH